MKIVKTLAIAIASMMYSFAAVADHHEGDHSAAMTNDIVDVAVANGSFTTLVTAIEAAGLVETLKGEGPFTVFAPTDAAFAKVPAATLNALLADKEALSGVLTYHVVAGKVMAKDVVTLTEATTVQGQKVMIEVRDGKVYVDNAQVIMTDVAASNGVIHVIDAVILPKP
jgi:uncharacterized surface protein with fasciclin (FAS1) repeats